MERPRIKDYKKDGNTYYHKSTKQNFEFDMSKYLNIVESGYRSQLKEYKKDVADWKLHYDALQSQLEERNYRYCPYCSHLLSHRVDTDANTKLVCKYALCPTKTQNQTKDEN